jgi:SulP family sulfate permease
MVRYFTCTCGWVSVLHGIQLIYSPSVVISLIIYQGINTQVQPRTTDEYVNWVLLISMIVGAMQFIGGIFRLGFLVNFMSKPILSGFTSGSAILIMMTQVKYLFGVNLESEVNPQIYWSFYYLGKAIFTPTHTSHDMGAHWPTILCAGICFFFLILLKYCPIPFRGRKLHIDDYFPSNLIVIISGTIIMTLISLAPNSAEGDHDVFGITVLGHLDTGLPAPKLPTFYSEYQLMNVTHGNATVTHSVMSLMASTTEDIVETVYVPVGQGSIPYQVFQKAFLLALPCLLIGFSEAYSVASFYAVRDNYQVDANQELMAIGLSAFVGSFFSAYTASTSFSRSALNAQTGVRSQLAGLLTAILMIPMLLWVMPLFFYLPKPLLGAMIILAVVKLVDVKMLKFLWQTKRRDFVLCLVCFLCTLFVGLEWGVIVAVLMSLMLVIYRGSRPRISMLGREPGTMNYIDIQRFHRTVKVPGVLILRFDAEMFFGNAAYLFDKIRKRIAQSTEQEIVTDGGKLRMTNKTRAFILDMVAVNQIDGTSILSLQDIKRTLDFSGIEWYLAGTKPEIVAVMKRAGFLGPSLPEDHLFKNVHDAVNYAVEALKETEQEKELQNVIVDNIAEETIAVEENMIE